MNWFRVAFSWSIPLWPYGPGALQDTVDLKFMRFSQIMGTLLGVPIISTITYWQYWGLYWGPPIFGNYHITPPPPRHCKLNLPNRKIWEASEQQCVLPTAATSGGPGNPQLRRLGPTSSGWRACRDTPVPPCCSDSTQASAPKTLGTCFHSGMRH